MTRFKELRRIEAAIYNENESELLWSLGYCAMRVKTAKAVSSMKSQEHYWRGVENKVRLALGECKSVKIEPK